MLSLEDIERKIKQAGDLGSVVRTMKAIAAGNIVQYQRAVHSLDLYYDTILRGIKVYTMRAGDAAGWSRPGKADKHHALMLVFGSDQGLVGPFNNVIASFCAETAGKQTYETRVIWAVGERVAFQLSELGLKADRVFVVPGSLEAVTRFVGQLVIEIDGLLKEGNIASVYTFFNRPRMASEYAPVVRQLLPLETVWQKRAESMDWESNRIPEIAGNHRQFFSALFREYLFGSLFRSVAYSLASENASRLIAMQRADKNIDELNERLRNDYHQIRQNSVDAELFDILAGFLSMDSDRKKEK